MSIPSATYQHLIHASASADDESALIDSTIERYIEEYIDSGKVLQEMLKALEDADTFKSKIIAAEDLRTAKEQSETLKNTICQYILLKGNSTFCSRYGKLKVDLTLE